MDVHELIRVFLKEENRKELSLYAYMLMGNKNDALDLLSDLLIEIYENPKMQDAIDRRAMACVPKIEVTYVVFALVGLAWAAINVNSLPMVVEMCRGSDIGKFTGYYYTFSMAAQVVTPIVAGSLMRAIDYRVLFPYAALFVPSGKQTVFPSLA